MHDSASQNWRKWRVTAGRTESAPLSPPPTRGNLVSELPGPDGIRWALVNRVRAEILAGTYDTDEKLARAEERLFASLAD